MKPTMYVLVNTKTHEPQVFLTEDDLVDGLLTHYFVDLSNDRPLVMTENGMRRALRDGKVVHVFPSLENLSKTKKAPFKVFAVQAKGSEVLAAR